MCFLWVLQSYIAVCYTSICDGIINPCIEFPLSLHQETAVGFASRFDIYMPHAIVFLLEKFLTNCVLTRRQLLHAIHMGLQLGAPAEDMMAAHCCQQITNAQQFEWKNGRKYGRKY